MGILLTFLPDEFLILVPLGLGILVILRIVTFGQAISILLGLFIMIALMPFVSSLLDCLPFWLLAILILFLGYSLVKSVSSALLGRGVTDHLFGSILYDLVLLPFRVTRWIFRTVLGRTGR
ncbi:MAG: hypothetical protein V1736_10405 [Pseudomonadota bacterium]